MTNTNDANAQFFHERIAVNPESFRGQPRRRIKRKRIGGTGAAAFRKFIGCYGAIFAIV
jgi:hypothetical protein